MDQLDQLFDNMELSDSSGSDTGCLHQELIRVTQPATYNHQVTYKCKQCSQWCQTTSFDVGSSAEISSNSSSVTNSSEERESTAGNDEESDVPSSNSRLQNDFVFLGHLGKGGFGAVAKYRNKKDDKIWAIKKVEAIKISEREVKVLSTLQHPNIVRYSTCWSEPNDSAFPNMPPPGAQSLDTAGERWFQENICNKMHVREPISNEETDSSQPINNTSSTEEESSDNERIIPLLSNYIPPELVKRKDVKEEEESANTDVLYIQMEFCEKGTLRQVIESGDLVRNRLRMWKLARQIVEGISYIHSEGVAHRDLKPENIFISSDGSAKIGDFGLAAGSTATSLRNNRQLNLQHQSSSASITGDSTENLLIFGPGGGTPLYMAPELASGNYGSNKVDMYSFGIIFYEMCHESFKTEWEEKLTELRRPDFIITPSGIPLYMEDNIRMNYVAREPTLLTKNMVEIVNQLLVHDPSKRLSAEDLLKSPIMHPPLFDKQPEFFQFLDFLLLPQFNPYSEYYQLMARCLNQTTSEGNILKWLDGKENNCNSLSRNDSLTLHRYPSILKIVFKRCEETGAQYFQPATLFPKMSMEENYRSVGLKQLATVLETYSLRSFVNEHGTLAVLPVDSHTPFARHVASYNIKQLMRYCVNQVYTSLELIGPPPEPISELAFDVVTPPSSSLRQADAEVLQVFHKILQDFSLSSYVLQLNHYSLLKAIFVHCKVSENQHAKACSLLIRKLNKIRNGVDGLIVDEDDHQLNAMFPPESLELVLKLLKVCGDLNDVKTTLASFADWVGSEAAQLADEAFSELEEIINIFRNKGSASSMCPISINLNIGIEYYRTHSGFLFSFIHQSKGFFNREITVLVKGGRYDALVQSFRNVIINQPFRQVCDDDRQNHHVTGGVIYVNTLLPFIDKK